MSNIGTYIITYNCSDTEGNQAMSKSRTVIVQADYTDTDEDGYDDVSYEAGAESGDLNLDKLNETADASSVRCLDKKSRRIWINECFNASKSYAKNYNKPKKQ